MFFIFRGKSIVGTDDKQQTIVYGKLEVRTNTVLGVLTASLATAVLPLILQFISGPRPTGPDAKNTCLSLQGDYKLRSSYIFAEKMGMRLIARKGKLRTDTCEPSEAGEFLLRGGDTTQFEVELLVNEQYQLAAEGEYHYPSEISIANDGKLISRTFGLPEVESPYIKYHYDELKEKGYSKTFEELEAEILRALAVRNALHTDGTTKSCDATVGKGGGRVILGFICHDYTRVMVKTRSNLGM